MAFVAWISAVPVSAAIIWGVGTPRDADNNVTGPVQLFNFDSTDPTNVTVIGSTNLPQNITLTGLDFAASGNLYAYGRGDATFT